MHTVIPIGLYLLQKIQALSLKNGFNYCSVPKLYNIQYHAEKKQLYHLNVIISPQNITDLKTLKPWCSICTIASPARISICKAEALNQLHAQPTVRNETKRNETRRCTPTSKRKDKMNDTLPQKPRPLSWVSLYEADVFCTSMRFTKKFLKHAKSIWQIFYSGYCVWPLVRLSLTHWLITWFHLIYKISKSSCILPYQWLQILPCNIKRKKKRKVIL